jgi:hypothetical protein
MTISIGPDHDHPTPPGQKKWGKYTVAWAGFTVLFFAIEIPAVIANKRGGREDYQHRTLTENIRAVFATDRDGAHAKHPKLRRIAGISSIATGVAHFLTDGSYV